MSNPAPGAAGHADAPTWSAGRARPRWRHPLVVAAALLALTGLVVLALVGVGFWRTYEAAEIPAVEDLERPDPTVLLDADGEVVQNLRQAAVQRHVALDALPEHVPAAVLAAEDRGYPEHPGFSVSGMVRAAWANLRAGGVQQGASTITQQYVALAIADIEDTFPGKFREVAIAARLDAELAKDEILELYLNAVPLGRTAIGIEAGAQTYFGVPAAELTVEQAATLAGMIAAPTTFDPDRNPDGAAARRDVVLRAMVETGAIDAASAEEHVGTPLPALRDDPLVSRGPAAYFVEAVRRQLPSLLDAEADDLATGLRVHTTLDPRAQELALTALDDGLSGESITGAVVTIDPHTGAYRAIVGGRDHTEQQFDVAMEGARQVGSAFKTFTLAELVAQGYHPDETRIDAGERFDIEVEDGPDVTVRNHGGADAGTVSAREATASSVNTAYMMLAQELGYDRVVAMAEQLGIPGDLPAYPSMTLGTADLAPADLTAAYATLAAEGMRRDPYLIERVETHDGDVVYEREAREERVIDAEVAAVVTDVLVDVVEEGTGTAADLDRPNAGKTGTTNDYRNAWFVGYTPEYATSVWVGNLDNAPMDEVTGGGLPASIWGTYMEELLEPLPVTSFPAADTSELVAMEEVAPEPEPRVRPTEPGAGSDDAAATDDGPGAGDDTTDDDLNDGDSRDAGDDAEAPDGDATEEDGDGSSVPEDDEDADGGGDGEGETDDGSDTDDDADDDEAGDADGEGDDTDGTDGDDTGTGTEDGDDTDGDDTDGQGGDAEDAGDGSGDDGSGDGDSGDDGSGDDEGGSDDGG